MRSRPTRPAVAKTSHVLGSRISPQTFLRRPLLLGLVSAIAAGFLPAARARAQETFTPLVPIKGSIATGEKPQSKLWFHDGRWWAVLASSSVGPTGTWLWRLESDNRWTNLLRLSSSTSAKADTIALGDVTHILLQQSSGQLVSVQYDPLHRTYELWRERPTTTAVNLSGSETATIDVDSEDRLWLSTESGSNVIVYYSDYPYTRFQGPISLDTHISSDDISIVTALPFHDPPQIGVFWSNQTTDRFGFRVHIDGTDPLLWMADESPASQSARTFGDGFADDHMNLKIGSDGTLYVAVKTSYNVGGVPHIELLVRRPNGDWDDAYQVNQDGTRPLLLLNEAANLLRVVDEDSGTIRYRDSLISSIHFGSQKTLMSGSLNDPTSTKMNWTDQVVVMAYGKGVLIRRTDVATTTTTVPATTTTTRPPTSTTTPPPTTSSTTLATTTTSSSTTTTLPPGAVTLEVRVGASSDDAEEASGTVDLASGDLELVTDGTKVQTLGMRFPGVTIPRGAVILEAWVQFEVDETSTNATTLRIEGEASDDAAPFTKNSRDVSSRGRTTAFVASWSPPNWTTVGDHGTAQRTPDLRLLVQEIVDRSAWQSGRALAVIVTGAGHRVARSYDGRPAGAPLLHVTYRASGGPVTTTTTNPSTTTTTTTTPAPATTTTTLPSGLKTVEVRVAASADDAEERASDGKIDLTSGDLEMVLEAEVQTVGMRFRGVAIPHNATIVAAWVQFQVDEVTTPVTTLRIQGQATSDALPFGTTAHDVSRRPRTSAFRDWSPPVWPQVGVAGLDQRSTNIAAVIQEIVNGSSWSSGKALALIVTGSGKRVARSWDGVPGAAPLLHVEYLVP